MVESIWEKILDLIEAALSWLPQSPFAPAGYFSRLQLDQTGLGWLNWFFPVHEALVMTAAWLGAIVLWYLATIVLRWVKAIE